MQVPCREQTLRGLAAATALLVAKGTVFVRHFLLWIEAIILLYWDRLLCHMQTSCAKADSAIQKGTWPRLAKAAAVGSFGQSMARASQWNRLHAFGSIKCVAMLLSFPLLGSLWMHCLYKLRWSPQMNLSHQHILKAADEQLAWTTPSQKILHTMQSVFSVTTTVTSLTLPLRVLCCQGLVQHGPHETTHSFSYYGIGSWEHGYRAARIIFFLNIHLRELDHIFTLSFYVLSLNEGNQFCFLLWNYIWWLTDEKDVFHKKRYNFLDDCLSIQCFCLLSHCCCMLRFFLLEVHRTVL